MLRPLNEGQNPDCHHIYDWYEDDFTRGGVLKEYVIQFLAPEAAEAVKKSSNVGIVFQEYNWALNDIQK